MRSLFSIVCICASICQALAAPRPVFPFGQSKGIQETIDVVFDGYKYPNVQGVTRVARSTTVKVNKKEFGTSEKPQQIREIFKDSKIDFLVYSVTVPPGYIVQVRQNRNFEERTKLYGSGWLASGTHALKDTPIWENVITTQRIHKFRKNPPNIVEGLYTWPSRFQLRTEGSLEPPSKGSSAPYGNRVSAVPQNSENSVMPKTIEDPVEPEMSGALGASKGPGRLNPIPENDVELDAVRGDDTVGVETSDRKTGVERSDIGMAVEGDGDRDGVEGSTDRIGVEEK